MGLLLVDKFQEAYYGGICLEDIRAVLTCIVMNDGVF